MSEENKKSNFILIVVFAIFFSFVVQDGIRLVIEKLLDIPDEGMGLAQWGETFFLRIFASLIATATGTFVIGTFLKTKTRIAAIIATIPTTLFWIATLILRIKVFGEYETSFSNIKMMLLQPGILAVLTPIVGYHGAKWGEGYHEQFQKPKSILNIKWYHWLWILPLYLNKAVAIPLLTLILLWTYDATVGANSNINMGIFDLIFNFGYYVGRIIILFIFIGLLASVHHVHQLLTDDETTKKINWKKGLIVFGHVFLFSLLYVLLFVGI